MTAPLSRAIMALAVCTLPDGRRDWSHAMQAEFAVAVAHGAPLRFAIGCLGAAWRDLLTHEEGCFALSTYGLALVVMMPMAALQIGCAVFGLPYLYPDRAGLVGALLEGRMHERLVRGIYQAAIPSLALLQILLGLGHLAIAWAVLERDWPRVVRLGAFTLAAAVTLIALMNVLFLDSSKALLQAVVLAIEFATLLLVARWHAHLFPRLAPGPEQPG